VLAFPLAFAVHDLEEVFAAPRWSQTAAARLTQRHPPLGRSLARLLPVSKTEMGLAVGVVAVAVGGVTVASLRNLDGDLRLFQAALAAISAHSLSHVGASALFRGYTPGVATVPTVIVPYSLWAWSRLHRAGVVRDREDVLRMSATRAALALPVALFGHVLARFVVRGPRLGRQRHPWVAETRSLWRARATPQLYRRSVKPAKADDASVRKDLDGRGSTRERS